MAAERKVVRSSTYFSSSGLLQDLRKLCNQGQLDDAIRAVDFLAQRGLPISISIFYRLLQLCIRSKNLRAGRHIHSLILRNGHGIDTFLGCHLVRMFSLCGSLLEADRIFNRLRKSSVFTWSAIISAHAKFGCGEQALKLYTQMQELEVKPGDYTFNAALQACSSIAALNQGNMIHSHIVESGLESDVFIGNTLINMYAKCGCLKDARNVFDSLPKRVIVAWSSMIAGYARDGNGQAALHLFQQMQQEGPQPNAVTFVSILKACSSIACLDYGKLMHALIIKSSCELDLIVGNTLIDMYGKCGSLEDADSVFYDLPKRSVVTWSAMLSTYAQHGHGQITLQLFQQMQQEGVEPDSATFVGVLKACSQREMLHQGKLVHVLVLEKDPGLEDFIGSILIDMYFRCFSPMDAYKVFEALPRQSVVPWNAIIAGFSQHGHFEEAIHYFQCMQLENVEPDDTTYASIVKACSNVWGLAQGELLCAQIIANSCDLNEIVGNALVFMYAKCGSLDNARRLFDKLVKRDVVSWSAMIAGYVQHGHGQEALHFFCNMQLEGKEPDNVTFLCILKACSILSALDQGRLVHAQVIENGWEMDAPVGNSLIDMYAKCGTLNDASTVFDKVPTKTVTTWNAMIAGFAHHSNYKLALKCFKDMEQKGQKPNDATFASLLSACNKLGLLYEGCLHFKSLRDTHCIIPRLDHYVCLIELLGRAGHLLDAAYLVTTSPFAPDLIMWTSLLSHSKAYGDLKLGKQCFDSIVSLDSDYASAYVIMSNFYAVASMPEDADNMQELRKHAKAWKKPGQAFIEVNDKVHDFVVHDQTRQESGNLRVKLQRLSAHMKRDDYVPWLDLVLHATTDQRYIA